MSCLQENQIFFSFFQGTWSFARQRINTPEGRLLKSNRLFLLPCILLSEALILLWQNHLRLCTIEWQGLPKEPNCLVRGASVYDYRRLSLLREKREIWFVAYCDYTVILQIPLIDYDTIYMYAVCIYKMKAKECSV